MSTPPITASPVRWHDAGRTRVRPLPLLVLLVALLLAPLLGAGTGGRAWAQATPAAAAEQPQRGDEAEAFREVPGLDTNELRRMIRIARDAGFTDEQIREITVEDDNGNVINAWAYLQAYERHKAEEQARREAERNRVYLSPKEILDELDAKQTEDIDKLRDKLLFTD